MKIYNFAAGPAMLPKAVMEKAQAEFTNYQNSGSGLMELSHRGKLFEPVLARAEANVRELLNVSDDYAVLFIQGGASMQFAMLAMNFLNGGVADYVDTGVWSSKALKEAKMFGSVNVVASSKETKYDHIPAESEWKRTADAAYLHITSNNTIAGTRFTKLPKPTPGVPMLSDMSSDIMSRPFDINDFGMVYAGAQKNLGPSGMALVILRKDLAARTDDSKVPTMLRYSTYIENDSMFNTPPTFAIYMLALVTDWVREQGGLAAMEKINEEKAAYLYDFLDNSSFYKSPVAKADRSIMNVVFRTPSEELDAAFVKEAKENGLTELKGHRLVGGCRASIYNAMPIEGVKALVEFMKKFELANK
ncbi:3-phosphoserine/phosphohydroxythreonine transaminase [Victivallaceae bacterium BBE-744-WT-12]|jgi:phosphoserine transaminase|uniref:Phosphoserine aminotransferase n=1 Tax=Victivallis lenta TaxID=2606640 RepID=A0A844G5T5_9BACT|nr:3-phosphoserine/phosphohydroxythreonine transaminase [Victivallis lenta]AVM47083.1 3-phosphoserine/phosphohydroxythreonine aminotransferase [Victivallales bacterium CCUG 44730]MBS1454346.1 3-phosphoserine/phosphohydroxythreonine transaminase [Lentisphaeria bacterium]MBS5533110.1 3-phosphoserine/phosphohydroxythreonine transaminase [bacterium]MST97941.1 3-phosphoserine/phosphohydroxythreonine transaminase [Victivallis lenta]HBP06620.1 3-phosphoserine/phosphohydroxythreonine transaminase [Len